ncbi:hypothetical protein MMC06_002356 [Schaereria dolodes]|nr:hypothetical protein [Schaereria dolodes]
MNRVLASFLHHSTVVEAHTPNRLSPDAEKERFVVIEPSTKNIYRAVLQDSEIKPGMTGGTWFPSLYQPGEKDVQKVILHFHGGAYTIGEGRQEDAGFAAKILTEHAVVGAKAFSVSYRLSSNEGGQFPAALQDAVTAYQYLLDLGIPARSIIVSGDSAGANLAIALLRYISDMKELLPDPSAALLWSPWVDVAAVRDPMYIQRNRHCATDFLPANFVSWGANTYIPTSMDAADGYISPVNHPFPSKTPLWIQLEGLEILYDGGIKFAENMKGIQGNRVDIDIQPYANHDLLVAHITGFTREAETAAKAAGRFVKNECDT